MATSIVDLRSDTVTQPTPQMRDAMAKAAVGDDGYGEDPTVNALEERFASLVGKADSVFVPSGVMANQIALRCLTRPGDTVLAGRRQHVLLYEMGAAGRNAGVQILGVDDETGSPDPTQAAALIGGVEHHQPAIAAIFVESPHMASGGKVVLPPQVAQLAQLDPRLPIHLDGARLFNAQVATGIAADKLAEGATTVMACLSKGLCAPAGSLLAGPSEVIAAARVERKRLGGALRQAGVLAAPGLVALEQMIDRLAEDHERARTLRGAVAERWPEVADSLEGQTTNLVVFEHADDRALVAHLASHQIAAGTIAPGVVRLVTHHDVDDEGIDRTCQALRSAP